MSPAPRHPVPRTRSAGPRAVMSAVAAIALCACSSSSAHRPTAAHPTQASGTPAASSGPLVGIGGTVSAYTAAHPSGAGGYGAPASIDGAVVLGFTRTLTPPVTAPTARRILRSDLPPDATVVADITQAACEQVWLVSSTVQRAMQASTGFVVVTFTSPFSLTYDPTSVGLLSYDNDLVDRPGSRSC